MLDRDYDKLTHTYIGTLREEQQANKVSCAHRIQHKSEWVVQEEFRQALEYRSHDNAQLSLTDILDTCLVGQCCAWHVRVLVIVILGFASYFSSTFHIAVVSPSSDGFTTWTSMEPCKLAKV